MAEITVFSNMDWYLLATPPEQEIEGKIRKTTTRPVVTGRPAIYHLETAGRPRYPIYTGGKQEEVFENLLDAQVVIIGKMITMAIDKTRKEIWPAAVRTV